MVAKTTEELIHLVIGNIKSDTLAANLLSQNISDTNDSIARINQKNKNSPSNQKLLVDVDPILSIIVSDESTETRQVDYDIDPKEPTKFIGAIARQLAKEQQIVSSALVLCSVNTNTSIEISFAFFTSKSPTVFRTSHLNRNTLSGLSNITDDELQGYVSPVQLFFVEYSKAWANLRKALVN